MADIGVELNEHTVSDDLCHDAQQGSRKLPSLSWKQRVIGFGITAGLAALFSILVSQYFDTAACFLTYTLSLPHVSLYC